MKLCRRLSSAVCVDCVLQEGLKEVRVLDNVVGIDVVQSDVENEVIANLSEPIRIGFHHDVIPVSLSEYINFK